MKFTLLLSFLLIGSTNGQLPKEVGDVVCLFYPCPSGKVCKAPNFVPNCVYVEPTLPPIIIPPVIVPPTGSLTCASIQCSRGETCAMVYPVGCPECQPHPQCLGTNACLFKRCRFNEECVLVQVFCPRQPCSPTAECVPRRNWSWAVGRGSGQNTTEGPLEKKQ